MLKNFVYWENQHNSEKFKEFNTDRLSIFWLKIKSIIRREYINQFCQVNDVEIENTRLNAQFKELYNILFENVDESHESHNNFIYILNY